KNFLVLKGINSWQNFQKIIIFQIHHLTRRKQSNIRMKIWKVLLLLSFLAATVYCEESQEVEEIQDEPMEVQDEPMTAQEDEVEEVEEDEIYGEEEDIEEIEENDAAKKPPKPKKAVKTKVYVEKNKNAGECKQVHVKRTKHCFVKKVCVHKVNYKCKKLRIQKFCKFTFKKECKVCSRFYFKTCTKKQGSPTLSCKKGPLQPRQCARKIVGHGSVLKVVDTKHQAV
uniref:Uncharacterized protein n=1 Tax=Clytia hemisphaerica TaxID=252671 RepID=A0A7M5UKB4_9CNID